MTCNEQNIILTSTSGRRNK